MFTISLQKLEDDFSFTTIESKRVKGWERRMSAEDAFTAIAAESDDTLRIQVLDGRENIVQEYWAN